MLSPVISWIDDGKVRSAASARCGRLNTGRRPIRCRHARSMRIGMMGALPLMRWTTGRVTMHGAEWYFRDGCLPWQTAGMGARPVEAHRLKRASPLVAIDHPSSPGPEAFRAVGGPVRSQPRKAHRRASVRPWEQMHAPAPLKAMGQQFEFFVPPTSSCRTKKSLDLRREHRSSSANSAGSTSNTATGAPLEGECLLLAGFSVVDMPTAWRLSRDKLPMLPLWPYFPLPRA